MELMATGAVAERCHRVSSFWLGFLAACIYSSIGAECACAMASAIGALRHISLVL